MLQGFQWLRSKKGNRGEIIRPLINNDDHDEQQVCRWFLDRAVIPQILFWHVVCCCMHWLSCWIPRHLLSSVSSSEFPVWCFPHCFMILPFCASPVAVLLSVSPLWFFCSALISFSCSLLISLPICISSQRAPVLLCKFPVSPTTPLFPVLLFSLSLSLVWTIVFV